MLNSVDNLLGMSPMELIAKLMVLFTALPIHEYAHASMAVRLGDDTPNSMGRLTLNPFTHLHPLGSLALLLLGFGWARPVPINPRNFKNYKRDTALTALAGPLANVFMALLSLSFAKVIVGLAAFPQINSRSTVLYALRVLLTYMMQINLWLAVFNLLPIPPLDGSKIFGIILPGKLYRQVLRYEQALSLALLILLYMRLLDLPLLWLSSVIEQGLNFVTRPIDLLMGFLAG